MANPLILPNHSPACKLGHKCPEAVVNIGGRFFVTFGHCGFNSRPNNARGYASPHAARVAILDHERPEFRKLAEAVAAVNGEG